jgi:hypothetical protein
MHLGYCIWEFLIWEISISMFPKKFPNLESPLLLNSKSIKCEVWLGRLVTELAEDLPTGFGQELPQRVFAEFLEILILFRPLKGIYIN